MFRFVVYLLFSESLIASFAFLKVDFFSYFLGGQNGSSIGFDASLVFACIARDNIGGTSHVELFGGTLLRGLLLLHVAPWHLRSLCWVHPGVLHHQEGEGTR
jgi:hypothetical protein